MLNMMTIEECRELLQTESTLTIRNNVKKGKYQGTFSKGERRNTYYVSRYWFYEHKLGWPKWKIEEYHMSDRGRYWLGYNPYAKNKIKEEPVTAGTPYVN